MNIYLALIESIDSKNVIRWRIPELIDNLTEQPLAYPITTSSSQLRQNDKVVVMQFNDEIQEYFYFPILETNFTGIRMGNIEIDATNTERTTDYQADLDNEGDSSSPEENDGEGQNLTYSMKIYDKLWYNEDDDKKVVAEISLSKDNGILMHYGSNPESITLDKSGLTVKGSSIKLNSGNLGTTITTKGLADPSSISAAGPFFCGPSNCPLSGIPLGSNKIIGDGLTITGGK